MNDDLTERLAELRDKADVFAQKLQPTAARAEFTGADSSEVVKVTMDQTGQIREVTVGRAWRERVGADGLPAAVREAVEAAGIDRLSAWGEAFARKDGAPDPRPRPAPLPSEGLVSQLDELATAKMTSDRGRLVLDELRAMLQSINDGVDQVTAQVQAHLNTTYAGRSQSGHVTVTVTGDGAVDEVRYDRRWLANAHEINIGRETLDALRAAYRRAGERTVAELIAASPLGDVQALARDPLGLARRLHLRDD